MRAAIYDPYLDTLGGGERYTLGVAKVLLKMGYQVDLQWKDKALVGKIKERFGYDCEAINFVENINRGSFYDLCFWLSDGSIPTLLARNNFIHFQRPFQNIEGSSLINKMKLYRVKSVIVNSLFTKQFIDREFSLKSIVVYPPVDIDKFKAKHKENIILYVGRFSQLEQAKGQEILIDSFIKLYKKGITDFKLILAGSSDVGRSDFIDKLKYKSRGYPILIKENLEFKILRDLYSRSMFFWSAAGFGINEKKEPQRLEHFGITLIEAMSAKAIPLVFNAGGHKEIIKNSFNGYLWNNEKELLAFTTKLINNKKEIKDLSRQANLDSQKYNEVRFAEKLQKIFLK